MVSSASYTSANGGIATYVADRLTQEAELTRKLFKREEEAKSLNHLLATLTST